MSATIKVTIFEDRREVFSEEYSAPVELGRQERDDEVVYEGKLLKDGRVRIPFARKDEATVARKQAYIEPVHEGLVRITNQSAGVVMRLVEDDLELKPTQWRDAALPVTLRIGPRKVSIVAVRMETLAQVPQPPGLGPQDRSALNTIAADQPPEAESLIPWLQATTGVLHEAATAIDCFDSAAGALLDVVGLDAGRVLLLEGADWRVKALKTLSATTDEDPWKPSSTVLKRLREEKRTFLLEVAPFRPGSLQGIAAVVAAPILDRQGEVIGALYGDRTERGSPGSGFGGPLTKLQAMLVQLLASGVAAGLAQKKLVQMERDMEIGRQIQAGFLPSELPSARGWDVAAHFRPAREVSGDFYDAFALPGGLMALVITDVCDKGVGAALYMTLLRSLLRAFAERAFGPTDADPSSRSANRPIPPSRHIAVSAVEQTNNYVAQTHGQACMFATLFFGVLDPATGRLTYINAGHDAPALLGAGAIKARLNPTGPVVGITPNIAYEIGEILMEPGDTLFTYTDGVTEARDAAGRFFTEQRLLARLQDPADSATALVDNVIAALNQHIAGAEPHDDVTMLVVRREP